MRLSISIGLFTVILALLFAGSVLGDLSSSLFFSFEIELLQLIAFDALFGEVVFGKVIPAICVSFFLAVRFCFGDLPHGSFLLPLPCLVLDKLANVEQLGRHG